MVGYPERYLLIRLVVTDGVQSMEMRPLLRSDYVQRRTFKKLGHLFRGKLNIGKRFTLLEYTIDVIPCPLTNKGIPIIFYKDIHAQPQKKQMKSFNRARAMYHASSVPRLPTKEEDKNRKVSFDTAVKEMQCQLERLQFHPERLGH